MAKMAAVPLAMGAAQGLMSGKGGGGGGGGKGGKGSRPQAPAPTTIPGALPFLSTGLNLFKQFGGPATKNAFGTAVKQLTQGVQTGFMPEVLAGVEQSLLPALERSFQRGSAAVNEGAANAGTLRSSSTTGDIADLRGGLESGLLSQLANLQGALAQQSIGARLGAGSELLRLPSAGLAAGGSFMGNIPFAQPQFGPSGKESKGATLAPIAGGLASNPGLFSKGGGR